MGRFFGIIALAAAFGAQSVIAQAANQAKCGPNSPCPASAPCCSPYGQCGVGAYCLGGCNPRFSNTLKSCVPNPTCQSKDYKMTSLDGIEDISRYLGDASKADWTVSGKPVVYNNEAVLMTMAPDTVGTLISSTRYIWYGKVSATMTTSKGAGVVTAFILMSDIQDEIDFEWVGVDLQQAQTNYYAQGEIDYTNGKNISAPNTDTETHVYTIDWTPDRIVWSVDGKELREKKKSDTWDAKSGRFRFPQTPARVQLSLWPAGLASNGKGTIDWAGGLVNWNSPDMSNGYYYAMLRDIKVDCYDPPSGASKSGTKSYIYADQKAVNTSVKITDDVTILKSLYATGDNPNIDPSGSSKPAPDVQTVPGIVGIGTRGDLPGGSSNPASGASGGFSQGTTAQNAAVGVQRSGGSAFAVLVAIVLVCVWL